MWLHTWLPRQPPNIGLDCCKVGQLRAERARYERALRRELDEASDWRGRAQQISLLQERLLCMQESQAGLMSTACALARPKWATVVSSFWQRKESSMKGETDEVLTCTSRTAFK